jgi:ElaB/YqjD/DUF883 family membrane-anchored ribosome-binding protein
VEDDLRLFIREQTARMEKATLHMERALLRMGDRMETSLERMGDRMEASLERMGQRIDDQGEQIRANTQAVLAMLDRLENGRA